MTTETNEDTIQLKLDEKNKLVVRLHGATLTSWACDGDEILFVSEKAVLDNKKAIRGGIPIVFPNFGPWSGGQGRVQHGFARTAAWSVKEQPTSDSESASVSLSLKDDEKTRSQWDYSFELVYTIRITKTSLHTSLTVHNHTTKTKEDSTNFDFTALLHTYFRVEDVKQVRISGGFQGTEFVDKVTGGQKVEKEDRELLEISGETDRVYKKTSSQRHVILTDKNLKKKSITIEKENLPDTVVWNPWTDKAKGMADFGDDEYEKMVCVEAGYVSERKVLPANESFKMSQTIRIN
jgi:glucose-6-phosphate 1-epimerase